MPLARTYQPLLGSTRRGVAFCTGRVVLGVGGAISTAPAQKDCGFKISKTAGKIGRYTITLDGTGAQALISARGTVIGANDAAYTVANGMQTFVRADDVGRNNKDNTFELQFYRTDTGADAEVEDNRDILITVQVSFSKLA